MIWGVCEKESERNILERLKIILLSICEQITLESQF